VTSDRGRQRVVLACDWFLKYASSQSAALARQGADVVLLCRTHADEFGGDLREPQEAVDAARAASVTVIETPGRLWDPRVAPELVAIRRRLASFEPDVVHGHSGGDPRALALLPRRPMVLTVHDPVFHPGQPVPPAHKRWLLSGGRRAWHARAAVIVVHSERLRSQVRLRPGQRCVTIAHGADVQAHPLPPPEQRAVGFFGRLAPYKGLDVLGRAMPRVWRVRPEVELRVAGWGEAELPLRDPRVHFERRYLPEAEVGRFFARSSLAVLPYTQASQTGVGSVAVGYGVPVVASATGGLPELTLDRSYLCTPGDDAELAGAILEHIDDGADVRRRVLDQVAYPRSWDAVASRTLELYESVL
jgi:glycosyltransferase involved in cell wall biosynthesis